MTYQETLQWMFSQLPMYQRQGQSAFKKDLSNTLVLSEHLNHPEHQFKSIHVAGTNGKGSTSHMLASILQEAGYKVGLYTSPHLKDFRERIRINGVEVSEDFVVEFISENKTFFEAHELSFFEMTVGMAFDYFKTEQVDIAVIEVGLGGRLDSTNIITPELSVITNIGLDHTQFLGTTLAEIASEKGGIIKPNVPVVIGETQEEIQTVFETIAADKKAKILFADQLITELYPSDLKGSYQIKNIKTVLQSINELKGLGFSIRDKHIQNGLLHVMRNTGLKGRWQVLQDAPKVVCDTGHNKEGLLLVMKQLEQETYNTLHIVFGVVSDKDVQSILPLLPKKALYYFCKPDVPRGMPANQLYDLFKAEGYEGDVYNSVNEAYKKALNSAAASDFIYIGGSTFVVAEII
ncbi:bifunctional folylpolyglutamate synthase/dihydrofolate synthase [Formosa algae]|uniref:Dihydrofolate synthase/folylpolyglutamate synthase n=1 Tax=Formosa algae TaxID=225843 RepID=A0A9X1C8J0_9FLAO|nr:folylpolyglutamate synthase/dihydrofolate synthase family protein [Formosa algae]MBP1839356.1 dihydrofolate synthase/folylpolyglutamate synthase [Formosa algae]MDQ0334660.1 dihydrofolate synthase/folylpolyglutamate synthase [Formosa algae]OEI81307.1 tetrahydrofolate synthase [Formosa algae]